MITSEQIFEIISPILNSENLFVVDIQVKPGNKITVAVDSFSGINIDKCAWLSRQIEAGLDREKEDFELEVSSPGLTSPFKVKEQYIKSIDKPVDVLLKDGEKLRGTIKNVYNNGIELEIQQVAKALGKKKPTETKEIVSINFDTIKHTKLVLTF